MTWAPISRTTHNNNIHHHNESFMMPVVLLCSGSSIANMNLRLLKSKSSVMDTLSTEDSSADISRLEGAHYSEPNWIDCCNLLSYPIFQSTTVYTPQMGQPNRQILQ